MLKPQSLADALLVALPQLAKDPDKVAIFIERGNVVAAIGTALAWEYRYTLSVTLLDYSGPQDEVFLAILQWVQRNQPELLQNADRRKDAISFEADVLEDKACDIRIELPLTESVAATQTEEGWQVEHFDEPDFAAALLPDPNLPPDTVLDVVYIDGAPLQL